MGRDKAALPVGGVPMLRRVVTAASEVGEAIVVVAAPSQELVELGPRVVVVRDAVEHEGPLVALARGMDALPSSIDRALVVGADSPSLHPAVVRRLEALLGPHDAAIPERDGVLQVLCAVYSRRVAAQAHALVGRRVRSVQALGRAVDVRRVSPAELLADAEVAAADPSLSSLLDVDTPDELAAADSAQRGRA